MVYNEIDSAKIDTENSWSSRRVDDAQMKRHFLAEMLSMTAKSFERKMFDFTPMSRFDFGINVDVLLFGEKRSQWPCLSGHH
jgi:hypothetical protein